jgi:hypothetical protein
MRLSGVRIHFSAELHRLAAAYRSLQSTGSVGRSPDSVLMNESGSYSKRRLHDAVESFSERKKVKTDSGYLRTHPPMHAIKTNVFSDLGLIDSGIERFKRRFI